MNKTAITIAYFVLIGLGVAAATIILLFKPDSIGVLVSTLTTVLGLGTVAAVTFSGLAKTNEKIEQVSHQTNGTLSKKDAEIARLTAELRRHDRLSEPSTFDETTGRTVTGSS